MSTQTPTISHPDSPLPRCVIQVFPMRDFLDKLEATVNKANAVRGRFVAAKLPHFGPLTEPTEKTL